jgi:hypothetical protein
LENGPSLGLLPYTWTCQTLLGAMHFFSDEILPFFNTEIGFFGDFSRVNLTKFFTIFFVKISPNLGFKKKKKKRH